MELTHHTIEAAEAAKEKAQRLLHEKLQSENVLQSNEIEANRLVGVVMFLSGLVVLLIYGLCRAHVFQLNTQQITPLVIQVTLELMIPALLCRLLAGRPKWLKYVLVLEFLVVLTRLDCALSYNAVLVMAIPTVLSCRYFSARFTRVIAVISAVLFAVSSFAGAWLDLGYLDLNFYDPAPGTVLHIGKSGLKAAVEAGGIDAAERTRQMMLFSYLPKLLIFCVIAVVCVKIAGKGKELVLRQQQITLKNARIESELTLANNIQAHMLPTIFPPFPNQREVELYAAMHPAKEVGGDFYDFFIVDEKNVAIVIADVSGKGIPAALVMVITKTLIKNEVSAGLSPAEAFTKVNQMLCEGNDDNMFVTAWLGVINTETGVLTYVNAGHNPPLVRHGKEEFYFLKSRPGLVLAGMSGLHYRQYELQMHPGDRVFLYTDGIPEAADPANKLYGNERLLQYLNRHADDSLQSIICGLTADVHAFAGEAEQSDDMTMLMMDYLSDRQEGKMAEKKVSSQMESLDDATEFILQALEKAGCPPKIQMQVSLCVEELFTNVAKYAYPGGCGDVVFGIRCENGEMTLRMADGGIPFDPLQQPDPDITLPAEQRRIGGLGILIVKKTMDEVTYAYENDQNVLTMKKRF